MPHNVIEFHNEPGMDEPSPPDHKLHEVKKNVCIGASDDPWDMDTPDPHDKNGHLLLNHQFYDHRHQHVLAKHDTNRMSPILENEDYNQCHHFEELISVGYPPIDFDGSEEPDPPKRHSTPPPRLLHGMLRIRTSNDQPQIIVDDPSPLHGMEPNPDDPAISEPTPPKEYLHLDPWEDLHDPHVVGHLPKSVGTNLTCNHHTTHHEFLLLEPIFEDEAFRQYDELDGTADLTTSKPIPPQPHRMHRPHPRQLHHKDHVEERARRLQLGVGKKNAKNNNREKTREIIFSSKE